MTDRIDMPSGVFLSLSGDAVRFGAGAVDRLAEDVDRLNAKRAFLITNRSIAKEKTLLVRVERLLGERHAGTHATVRPHVPASDVWAAAESARRCDADILISLGGGSAIDCAKLVAFVLAGGASSIETLCQIAVAHRRPDIGPPLPQIAISTTLSAAEFSPAAGVTDEGSRVKGVIANSRLAPRIAVLDPAVTVSTPRELWLSSGIKALDHAVERFCAHDHQPLVDTLCVESARLLIEHLPASADSGDVALAARAQCQIGAWLSFYGWLNVRTGLSHVLGHQLGARFGVPHGHTSCVTLPHVIRLVHAETSAGQFARLTHALGLAANAKTAPAAIADIVAELVHDFALPSTLRALGVPADQLDPLIAAASEEFIASGRVPPGQLPPDIGRVVHAAW